MKVSWDKWEGVYNRGSEAEIFAFAEIENLIKRLDQSTYNQVILNGAKNYLLIGGGENQYIVTLVIGTDEDFYTLVNKYKKDIEEDVEIVAGGQAGLFPKKIVVDYNSVIEASHYYFENFDKNPNLLWINE